MTEFQAEALDIADGTVYNYSGSKCDILVAIMDRAKADARVLSKGPGALDTREDLVVALVVACDALMAHLPFMRTLLIEAWSDDTIMQDYLVAQMANVQRPAHASIRARIECGAFRPVDPALATQMRLGMVLGPISGVLRGAAPALCRDSC